MAFTVEVSFTGLGIALIHQQADGSVAGVDLLLIDSSMALNDPLHQHQPRISFELEDLAKSGADFLDTPSVTTAAMPLVSLDLTGQDCQVNAPGAAATGPFQVTEAQPGATGPGPNGPLDAIDWLPDLEANLGISDLILPGAKLAGSPYVARVRLPAGSLSSGRLFLNADGTNSGFTYGANPTPRVLADQLIWTRPGVDALQIALAKGYTLDTLLRNQRGEPNVVRFAVTNLPARMEPQRYRDPDHFPMFGMVSQSSKTPATVDVVGGVQVCGWGSCPPAVVKVNP